MDQFFIALLYLCPAWKKSSSY